MLKLQFTGFVSKTPEMRYLESGTAVTNFNVAVKQRSYAENCPNGWKKGYTSGWECTQFWKVTIWGKQAESCNQYLDKGSQVYVEGIPKGNIDNGIDNPRVWTGNDGVARASYEITAKYVEFLSGRSDSTPSEQESNEPEYAF